MFKMCFFFVLSTYVLLKASNRLLLLFFCSNEWQRASKRMREINESKPKYVYFSLFLFLSLCPCVCVHVSRAYFFLSVWSIGRLKCVIYYFEYHYLGHRNHYRHRLIWLNMLDIYSKQYMVRPTVEAAMQPIIVCQNWQKYRSLVPYAIPLMHENDPIYFYMDLYHNGVARNHPMAFVESIETDTKENTRTKLEKIKQI